MTDPRRQPDIPTVAVVGGGLAGLAAAAALAGPGSNVELFERRKTLGGRAGSFRDPKTGTAVDYCQHVAMRCCTNLLDFCRRTDLADCFRRDKELFFFGPDGRQCNFSANRWLPVPLHLVPGLLRLKYLTPGERLSIARAMRRLSRWPEDDGRTIGAWLRSNGQSARAIERFWSVVLVGALSETVDRASLAAARKVFRDGFLASRYAYELQVPRLPLGEIFDHRVAAWLEEHGAAVHRGAKVAKVEAAGRAAAELTFADGRRREFDFVIAAVPWHRAAALFSEPTRAALPGLDHLADFRPAPITAVHLWFDRPLTPLPHAVLVERLGQWVFNHGTSAPGHYYQVVISASRALAGRRRSEVVEEVCNELAAIWPASNAARLLHYRMVTHPAAVFSVRPGLQKLRPAQRTPLKNLFLAGDWTDTGWPATMEGAVRSGYLAAKGVLQSLGRKSR